MYSARFLPLMLLLGESRKKPQKTHHTHPHVPQGLWGPLPPRGEIRGTQKAPNPSARGPKRFFSARAVDWCPPRPGHPKPIARDI